MKRALIASKRLLETSIQIQKDPIDESAEMQGVRIDLVKNFIATISGNDQVRGYWHHIRRKVFPQIGA